MRNLIALTLVVISIGTSAHAGNIFLENNKALRGLKIDTKIFKPIYFFSFNSGLYRQSNDVDEKKRQDMSIHPSDHCSKMPIEYLDKK